MNHLFAHLRFMLVYFTLVSHLVLWHSADLKLTRRPRCQVLRHCLPASGALLTGLGSILAQQVAHQMADFSSDVVEATTGWKTVVIQDGKFHAAVIGKVSGDNICALSPVSFHKYVRKSCFARWLDASGARATRGALKITQLAKLLGVQPLCTWVPSERMLRPTGLGGVSTQDGSSRGFEAMVSLGWLILYTLLVNCCNLRKATAAAVALRKRAFEVLDMLIRKACQASGASTLHTTHATFSVSEDGRLQGDDHWKQLVATRLEAHDTLGLARVCAEIQAGQASDNARVGEG